MWESAATIMLMVASLTQLVAAVAMMYLIQQTKTHKRDKIQDFPTDEDVARKDKEDEEKEEEGKKVVPWRSSCAGLLRWRRRSGPSSMRIGRRVGRKMPLSRAPR